MLFFGRRKQKLAQLTKQTSEYIGNHYEDARYSREELPAQRKDAQDSGVKYSRRLPIQRENTQISFFDNIPPDKPQDSKVQYSISEDHYDSASVQATMREVLASDSPLCAATLLDRNTNQSFVDKLLEHITYRHLRDSQVYKAAQIDRRLFSKIVSNRQYQPSKDTCIVLCLALQLTLTETNDLLSRAGYAFSHSNRRDVALEFFFSERIYRLNDINDVLYRLELKTLGR